MDKIIFKTTEAYNNIGVCLTGFEDLYGPSIITSGMLRLDVIEEFKRDLPSIYHYIGDAMSQDIPINELNGDSIIQAWNWLVQRPGRDLYNDVSGTAINLLEYYCGEMGGCHSVLITPKYVVPRNLPFRDKPNEVAIHFMWQSVMDLFGNLCGLTPTRDEQVPITVTIKSSCLSGPHIKNYIDIKDASNITKRGNGLKVFQSLNIENICLCERNEFDDVCLIPYIINVYLYQTWRAPSIKRFAKLLTKCDDFIKTVDDTDVELMISELQKMQADIIDTIHSIKKRRN